VLSINAYDASGFGVCLGAFLPKTRALRGAERRTFERVATHLAAGFRLRRRARAAEAILSVSGTVLHASASAETKRARVALHEAVKDIERARGSLRTRDPEHAVMSWRALVRARWSLVDHFEHDGKRLIVAIANESAQLPVQALTPRERSVMALAAQEHTTKLIAYELGLSDSTVRVLLMRAARTLGARTRSEALERYRKLGGVYKNT
jgi:DNA-binding CsgD family transcriptional regulator